MTRGTYLVIPPWSPSFTTKSVKLTALADVGEVPRTSFSVLQQKCDSGYRQFARTGLEDLITTQRQLAGEARIIGNLKN